MGKNLKPDEVTRFLDILPPLMLQTNIAERKWEGEKGERRVITVYYAYFAAKCDRHSLLNFDNELDERVSALKEFQRSTPCARKEFFI
jgi:hypothetical protein